MSNTSSILSLPYIQPSQAQKHVPHNEALRMIDSLIQLTVIAANLTIPPTTPTVGDRYIVGATATSDWAGQDNNLAVWDESHWRFYTPLHGWTAWDQDKNMHLVFDGAAWINVVPALEQVDKLGINTTADDSNRLSVAGDTTLFTHDGAGHQVKVNKIASDNTASLLFQTGWSGRAEMGTIAGDDFAIKTSPDGVTFYQSMVVDHTDGHVDFPQGASATGVVAQNLVVAKDTDTDTNALRFETAGIDHTILGTDTQNNLTLKVSDDGTTFHNAIHVDRTTGEVKFPNTVVGGKEFGDGDLLTVDYMAAKGTDLITNGTGLLGNNYNMPADFTYDPTVTPGLPASFSYAGHYDGIRVTTEFLPINPNLTYRLSAYIKQEALSGDWSVHTNGDRHLQYMGILAYDVDKQQISAMQHMRWLSDGQDSLTTLTSPLSPGDTQINVASAAGWNDTTTAYYRRGVIVFGYKNSLGGEYQDYSRFVQFSMFDLSGVDKDNNIITLNTGFPTSLGNPNDPSGTWPVGTRIANSSLGNSFKYSLLPGHTMPSSGDWYQVTNHMGGIDRSGTNVPHNFPPGTAFVKLLWLPNYSNRAGGWGAYPDTGQNHRVWFTGLSVVPDYATSQQIQPNGSVALKKQINDFDTGTVALGPQELDMKLV